jgi:hypothetical protein
MFAGVFIARGARTVRSICLAVKLRFAAGWPFVERACDQVMLCTEKRAQQNRSVTVAARCLSAA